MRRWLHGTRKTSEEHAGAFRDQRAFRHEGLGQAFTEDDRRRAGEVATSG